MPKAGWVLGRMTILWGSERLPGTDVWVTRYPRLIAGWLLVMLTACSAPGTPLMRDGEQDGGGPLIEGCHNVVDTARAGGFITTSYLTTWSSASHEGYLEGVRRGLDDPTTSGTSGGTLLSTLYDNSKGRQEALTRLKSSPASKWREKTNNRSSVPPPFCRRYSANTGAVFEALESTFNQLDYPISLIDEGLGIFETDFVERKHIAARWRDRYVIFVDSENEEQSVVRIYRSVYIDRSGDMFNQGESVGHNEAWIMNRISQYLAK